MINPLSHRIACFISHHGYGHAARAAGIMEALSGLDPLIRFELFTMVPRWFFADSLFEGIIRCGGLPHPNRAGLPSGIPGSHHFSCQYSISCGESFGTINDRSCHAYSNFESPAAQCASVHFYEPRGLLISAVTLSGLRQTFLWQLSDP